MNIIVWNVSPPVSHRHVHALDSDGPYPGNAGTVHDGIHPLPTRPVQRQRSLRPHSVQKTIPLRRGGGRGKSSLLRVQVKLICSGS